MQDDLKHILEEIIKIDRLACENKTENEKSVVARRQKYELEMENYEQEQLQSACKEAEKIIEQAITVATWQQKQIEDTVKKEINTLENEYNQIENQLVDAIMNELLKMEG
jgi:hypothetical protein